MSANAKEVALVVGLLLATAIASWPLTLAALHWATH
jgi:hypothetical protein